MNRSSGRPAVLLDFAIPVHAVVPAAGRGLRYSGSLSKQFEIVSGKPLLAWTIDLLLEGGVASVTVALPAESAGAPPEWLSARAGVRSVAGGSTRQASVALAVAESPARPGDLLLVHDGARPALAPEDLLEVCRAAASGDGAVLGRSLSDTLKRLEQGRIVETLDRSGLFRAETPQVFRREVLERAFAAAASARFLGTDESSLVERLPGMRITAVEARSPNPKLTTPADLPVVRTVLDGPSR
jgi:2-C-methyl-D-erythritol 4-phosphate cytidylyltransferase